jgi:hypothetical protein
LSQALAINSRVQHERRDYEVDSFEHHMHLFICSLSVNCKSQNMKLNVRGF